MARTPSTCRLGTHPRLTRTAQQILKVLPNCDIVVTGDISPTDRLTLDAYAAHTADRVWTLRDKTLLAAIDAGGSLQQLRQFLVNRAGNELPNPVMTLLADVAVRATRLQDLGVVRLIECADPALAALIANDRRLRRLSRSVGDRLIAVTIEQESEFRNALRTLGYVLPAEAIG